MSIHPEPAPVSPTDAISRIRQVTWIGLGVNLFLTGFKFFAGVVGESQAVIADAVHSLSDTSTDIAVIVGSYYWASPPDQNHPYGHGRIETLVTILIGLVLMAAALGIGWEALSTLQEPDPVPPGWIALSATAVSMVSKEILYRWTAAQGKAVKSPALAANAWDHRLDALSSIPTFLAVGGAILFPAWNFLDHLGAVVVSLMIFHVAFRITWPSIGELLDVGAPRDVCRQIQRIVLAHPGVLQVHRIRTRYVSTSLQVDLHVVVDGSLTVKEGHDIAEEVKRRLLADGPDVVDAVIHIEPPDAALPDDECL